MFVVGEGIEKKVEDYAAEVGCCCRHQGLSGVLS